MNQVGKTGKEMASQESGFDVGVPSEATIKEFIPASWFHPVGIFKVLARFWDRLPDVGGKLFLTFTLDPKNYADEETAFEDSRDWLRKVFFKLRQGIAHEGKLYVIDAPYCIKVEFHESGWVHYHAIFLTRRFLPKELLATLWDRGWVEVQRIENDDFHYLLKYVTKPDQLTLFNTLITVPKKHAAATIKAACHVATTGLHSRHEQNRHHSHPH